jgi:hypothetical protein
MKLPLPLIIIRRHRLYIYKLHLDTIVSDGMADVVDVAYVRSVGCLGVGGTARGEQLIANQGQELMGWMGIHTTSKRSRISKLVKKGG